MITASLVKELREKTGAGMLDCKKALEATNADLNAAADWLREKGISKAAKKADRIAAEGVAAIKVDGNNAVVVEVNSETDFVAKNEEFTNFVDYLVDVVLNNDLATVEDVMNYNDGGETISEKLAALVAKIGEKISFRRFDVITKSDDEIIKPTISDDEIDEGKDLPNENPKTSDKSYLILYAILVISVSISSFIIVFKKGNTKL